MKHLAIATVATLLIVTQGVARAQIYETRDAQGNPVFSDEPVDSTSSTVDLGETNIADAPPPSPQQQATPDPATKNPETRQTIASPARQDPNAEAWEERERRQAALDRAKSSSTPHEVLDAEPPREVLDAEPEREVMDAGSPRELGDF